MNTIIQQLKEQFPEIFPKTMENNRYEAYKVLHHFGNYCVRNLEKEETQEILNAINKIYQRKNLFTSNAIENEFLFALATELGVTDLMKHLKILPENLWAVYISVLIETQKNNKL